MTSSSHEVVRVWVPDEEAAWLSGVVQSHEGDVAVVELEESADVVRVPRAELLPRVTDEDEAVNDLIKLQHLHEPSILRALDVRYAQNKIYTYTGAILIALNPWQDLPLYMEDVADSYADRGGNDRDPHIFAVGYEAYQKLQRTEQSQTILVSGESGSGKTESTKILLRYFVALTGAGSTNELGGRRGSTSSLTEISEIEAKLLETNPLLEAFGNAKTLYNHNSSRFGKFIQVRFAPRTLRIRGAVIETYLLEKTRVVRQNYGERNYHIFYQLCEGTTADEKDDLDLYEAEGYDFLSQSESAVVDGVDDAEEFANTRAAMECIGIDAASQRSIFRILSGILCLGNIGFVTGSDGESAELEDPNTLALAASILGVDVAALDDVLRFRAIVTPEGEIRVANIPRKAADARDALACAIYSRVFMYIVDRVNVALAESTRAAKAEEVPASTGRRPLSRRGGSGGAGGAASPAQQAARNHLSIGILDIFGFESFEVNSFEQLCINYANEKLQFQFNEFVFRLEQEEYAREGIPWSYVEFLDNQGCLELIEGKPRGIIALLDDECLMPRGNDENFLHGLMRIHRDNEHFALPSGCEGCFMIRHYAGGVTYSVDHFVEKNKDELYDTAKTVMAGSSEVLVASLFPSQVVFESVASQFRSQLATLVKSISVTRPHYIRCLNPNMQKQPHVFDPWAVLRQLRCGGVMEAVRVARAGFPSRMPHRDLLRRYAIALVGTRSARAAPAPAQSPSASLSASTLATGSDLRSAGPRAFEAVAAGRDAALHRSASEILVQRIGLDPAAYRCGRTITFLRSESLEMLEDARMRARSVAAAVVAAAIRGRTARNRFLRVRAVAIWTAARWRRFAAQRRFQRARASASYIARAWRGCVAVRDARSMLEELRIAAEEAERLRIAAEEEAAEARRRAEEEEAEALRRAAEGEEREREEAAAAKARAARESAAARDAERDDEREREGGAESSAGAMRAKSSGTSLIDPRQRGGAAARAPREPAEARAAAKPPAAAEARVTADEPAAAEARAAADEPAAAEARAAADGPAAAKSSPVAPLPVHEASAQGGQLARLADENARLSAENARLAAENARLAAENRAMRATSAEASTEASDGAREAAEALAQLQLAVTELNAELASARAAASDAEATASEMRQRVDTLRGERAELRGRLAATESALERAQDAHQAALRAKEADSATARAADTARESRAAASGAPPALARDADSSAAAADLQKRLESAESALAKTLAESQSHFAELQKVHADLAVARLERELAREEMQRARDDAERALSEARQARAREKTAVSAAAASSARSEVAYENFALERILEQLEELHSASAAAAAADGAESIRGADDAARAALEDAQASLEDELRAALRRSRENHSNLRASHAALEGEARLMAEDIARLRSELAAAEGRERSARAELARHRVSELDVVTVERSTGAARRASRRLSFDEPALREPAAAAGEGRGERRGSAGPAHEPSTSLPDASSEYTDVLEGDALSASDYAPSADIVSESSLASRSSALSRTEESGYPGRVSDAPTSPAAPALSGPAAADTVDAQARALMNEIETLRTENAHLRQRQLKGKGTSSGTSDPAHSLPPRDRTLSALGYSTGVPREQFDRLVAASKNDREVIRKLEEKIARIRVLYEVERQEKSQVRSSAAIMMMRIRDLVDEDLSQLVKTITERAEHVKADHSGMASSLVMTQVMNAVAQTREFFMDEMKKTSEQIEIDAIVEDHRILLERNANLEEEIVRKRYLLAHYEELARQTSGVLAEHDPAQNTALHQTIIDLADGSAKLDEVGHHFETVLEKAMERHARMREYVTAMADKLEGAASGRQKAQRDAPPAVRAEPQSPQVPQSPASPSRSRLFSRKSRTPKR